MLGYTPFPKKIKYMKKLFKTARGLYFCDENNVTTD